MKADTALKEGKYVTTLGYYEVGDGGAATYQIVNDSALDDGGTTHVLSNNMRAKLIVNNYVTPEMFGCYGDKTHDDTASFLKAINSQNKIKGVYKKTYKIDKIITTEKLDISDCNIYSEPFQSETDVKFLFRIWSTNAKFKNCTFSSEFRYTPVINIINGLNQGTASNVIALRCERGCEILNCNFNNIYGIDSRGETNVINCKFSEAEIGIFTKTDKDVTIENCKFVMNRLCNSFYYHALYIQASGRFIANNIMVSEINEGRCGDHFHFFNISSSGLTSPNAIISNCIIDGDLSFDYISQNNNADLLIDNLIYKGSSGGRFQTGQAGKLTVQNSIVNCNTDVAFECYNKVKTINSIFNCTNNEVRLATRCNLEMRDTIVNAAGLLNMHRLVGSLNADLFNCTFNANSINSINCGGDGVSNNIINCVYNITTGAINMTGNGFISGIIRHAENPTSLGTIANNLSYDLLIYDSSNYFKRATNINSFS